MEDPTTYRKVICELHYLALTRPDICYEVNMLSQSMHQPYVIHWTTVKRLLRYLKETQDYAGDHPLDRTSTTGYIIYFGETPISWSSKKQKSV